MIAFKKLFKGKSWWTTNTLPWPIWN